MNVGALDAWQRIADLGPFAVLLAAVIAFTAAVITLRQNHLHASRTAVDRDRTAWWAQAQWALTMAASSEPFQRELGLLTLPVLAESSLVDSDQKRIVEQVVARMIRIRGEDQ